jgi:hypothetical protein
MGLLYLIWVGLYAYVHRRDDARSGGAWTGGSSTRRARRMPARKVHSKTKQSAWNSEQSLSRKKRLLP